MTVDDLSKQDLGAIIVINFQVIYILLLTITSVILHVYICLYLRVHINRYKLQYLLVFLAQYERIYQTYNSVYVI